MKFKKSLVLTVENLTFSELVGKLLEEEDFEKRGELPVGKLTFLDLVWKVLKEENRPLYYKEIWAIAVEKGYDQYLESKGQTPDVTLGARVYTDIKNNGEYSQFVKKGKGVFALKEDISSIDFVDNDSLSIEEMEQEWLQNEMKLEKNRRQALLFEEELPKNETPLEEKIQKEQERQYSPQKQKEIKMVEMKVESQNVLDYLSRNKFLIPMYQRNYVWQKEECETLWEDVCNFFDSKNEEDEEEEGYFLGSIVLHKEGDLSNIIDGQQRTTTLSLLLRSLYEATQSRQFFGGGGIVELKRKLASSLWENDKISGDIIFNQTRLKSEVATDNDRQSLSNIFQEKPQIEKSAKKQSLYEKNFLYFQEKIREAIEENSWDWFKNFCLCLLEDCVILSVVCGTQDKALRIFNTLNSRGVSLSAADIIKGMIFSSKKSENERKIFAQKWKKLEEQISDSDYLKKDDLTFLFEQYKHIIRAEHRDWDTASKSGVLPFWTKKHKLNSKKRDVNYAANDDLLDKEETFEFIQKLGAFWCNPPKFMETIAQKYFFVLNIYQNKLWQMVLSTCFYMDDGEDKSIFNAVLPQLAAYCALALMYGKGGNSSLFSGLMKANINILQDQRSAIFETSLGIPKLEIPSFEIFQNFFNTATAKQKKYIKVLDLLLQETEDSSKAKNVSAYKELSESRKTSWLNKIVMDEISDISIYNRYKAFFEKRLAQQSYF